VTAASWDTALLLMINQGTANGLFDLVMPFLSNQGYLLVLPFFLILLFRSCRQPPGRPSPRFLLSLFLLCCAAVLCAELAEYVLKNAIGRIRPCRVIEGIRLITACPRSYSMPSGHALSSFAFAAPLFLLCRPFAGKALRTYPVLLAAAIAFSRVYLGVHYPSDVLTGGLLGALIGSLLALLFDRISRGTELPGRNG
jgi:undecaprenyl-diphosphatase